jgi:hypothetical protein
VSKPDPTPLIGVSVGSWPRYAPIMEARPDPFYCPSCHYGWWVWPETVEQLTAQHRAMCCPRCRAIIGGPKPER